VPKLSHSHLCQRHDDTALPFLRQRLPHRRGRTFAHCAIQASAPGRSALEIRPSVIRRISSTYQRCCQWYIETTLDEFKTHLRGAKIVLRSKTPDLVRQEFYGLIMAHFATRGLMHEASLKADTDPDRLSFVHAVRVIRRKLPQAPAIPPSPEARLASSRARRNSPGALASPRTPPQQTGRQTKDEQLSAPTQI
jgi:hypothetical protein